MMQTTVNINDFLVLKSSDQVQYFKAGWFLQLSRPEKIRFLKHVLAADVPATTTASALRGLRELNYPDRYYFRKFLYHIDSSVANAARKAIKECCAGNGKHCSDIVKVLEEGKTGDRVLLADHFLREKGKLNEQVLISFLSIDDLKVRENIINNLTDEHEMNEAVLSETITRGAAWYVRAALVEILGNRKSQHLFDSINFLIKDRNVEVKMKLVHALLKYELEKRDAYLSQLANDSLIWVRKEAERALQRD
ncbi:MAG: HEAT repeat domain-containing protein [bacterium]|nr:HEAT repeat domain-containing protein [bacterium]